MAKVGVIGATGYTGEELIRLLLGHPQAEITYVAAKIEKPAKINEIFPHFGKLDLLCDELKIDEANRLCDCLFLALPHTVSMQFVPAFLEKNKKVIDLSADYRLEDKDEYKQWYVKAHSDLKNLRHAVYGLPEINREKIKKAGLIANPGCYPTSVILVLLPLLKKKMIDTEEIIIDSKSGISGAGRRPDIPMEYKFQEQFIKAYKISRHQHIPEINQELSKAAGKKVSVTFCPHAIAIHRGILTNIYVKLLKPMKDIQLLGIYKSFYKSEPFVKILDEGKFPDTKNVYMTNFCEIGVKTDGETAVLMSAIDNLTKGAAGQAVQNFNIMYGFDEEAGLT